MFSEVYRPNRRSVLVHVWAKKKNHNLRIILRYKSCLIRKFSMFLFVASTVTDNLSYCNGLLLWLYDNYFSWLVDSYFKHIQGFFICLYQYVRIRKTHCYQLNIKWLNARTKFIRNVTREYTCGLWHYHMTLSLIMFALSSLISTLCSMLPLLKSVQEIRNEANKYSVYRVEGK